MSQVPFVVHVVDDDPAIRESLKGLLSDAGYQVDCYSSAEAFLQVRAPRRGLALIDLRLKGTDGITLQKELIANNAAVSVIMMSAYGDIEHAVTAMRLGAVDFVEKPFSPEGMLEKIDRLSKASDNDDTAKREARQHAALIELLTPREKQVLSMIVDGLANKQVAGQLGISARTVETHRVHLMQKLNAESLPHLVRIWLSAGNLIEVPEF
ncbi:LuxR family DNA-binding response regulator [Salinisphaera dokdonensis CL-ES53]|uniref:LuxR family DNA-binding response regulator n=1 Tax=Salinisphaera dokdonensis CL-ES53 TaxID=1304272 RepID=A0ABV2B2Q1_9GAMM